MEEGEKYEFGDMKVYGNSVIPSAKYKNIFLTS